MNEPTHSSMTDEALIEHLRRIASIWFKNADLLALEELIRRYNRRLRREGSHPNNAKPGSTPIV